MKIHQNSTAKGLKLLVAKPLVPLPGAGPVGSSGIGHFGAEVLRTKAGKTFVRFDMGRRDEILPMDDKTFCECLLSKSREESDKPYDNVSSISTKSSDALCRLSTGTPAHAIIINGIDEQVMRADLADRCIFVNLASITDQHRRAQEEIWAAFETMRPRILGVLFDAVAHGLRCLPTTRLDALPRVADFARWATACEGAFWPEGTFMAAYLENRADVAEHLIENDVVAAAVRSLMKSREAWSGTATDLDTALRVVSGNIEGGKGWPLTARSLANALRGLAASLGKIGIEVGFARRGHAGTREVVLSRITEPAPARSSGEH